MEKKEQPTLRQLIEQSREERRQLRNAAAIQFAMGKAQLVDCEEDARRKVREVVRISLKDRFDRRLRDGSATWPLLAIPSKYAHDEVLGSNAVLRVIASRSIAPEHGAHVKELVTQILPENNPWLNPSDALRVLRFNGEPSGNNLGGPVVSLGECWWLYEVCNYANCLDTKFVFTLNLILYERGAGGNELKSSDDIDFEASLTNESLPLIISATEQYRTLEKHLARLN